MRAGTLFLVAIPLLSPSLAGGQAVEGPTRSTNTLMVMVRSDVAAGELPGYVRVEFYRQGELWRDEAADASGQYSFSGLPDGRYTVLARGLHSQSVGQTVDLSQNQTRQVVLRLIPNRVPWPPVASSRNSQALVSVEELAAPGRARKEFSKAYRRYLKQDLDGAIKHQLRGLEAAPRLVPAHNQLAFYYLQLGELDKAQESLEAALELDPNQLAPYLGLAEVLAEEKEFRQAGQVLLQANKSHPSRGEPYYVAARIYYRQGNLDYAEQSGHQALERDHGAIPEAHLLLVKIYSRRRMHDKLAHHLEAYLAEAPRGQHAEQARAHLKRVKQEQARTSP